LKKNKTKFGRYFRFYSRFFILGLAVILVVELGALIFVDKSYLQETPNDLKTFVIPTGQFTKNTSHSATLDNAAQNIGVSYDGNFLAYTINGTLTIMNMTNGQTYAIDMDQSMKLGYYKWVYDRDQLIIAEMSTGDSYYAKLYNLNAAAISTSKIPDEIRDTVNNREEKIPMPTHNSYISGLDFSTLTVTSYLKITNGVGHSILWKFDVPYHNEQYNISPYDIGNMQCLKNVSELMYENTANGKVNVAYHDALTINGEQKFKLLGFDSNDDVYLARGDAPTTEEILYGSIVTTSADGSTQIDLAPTDMQSLKLDKSVKVSGLHISLNGDIYYDDTANSKFVNLKTGKAIDYTGEVCAVYDQGFITVRNGVAHQNSLS
jgi:hypothetical protein